MQPNVILVTTDQQRKDSLGAYGSSFVHTPFLDRMAEDGVLFERAYCANPVCTPSRATIFSGKYVSKHGAWNVGTNVPGEIRLLPHFFKEAGYSTYHIGKLHLQAVMAGAEYSVESPEQWESRFSRFHGPYYGFDRVELSIGHTTYGVMGHYGLWVKEKSGGAVHFPSRARSGCSFGGEAVDWDIPPELTNTAWVAERAVKFIESQQGADRPFFLNIGFQDPHHPHALPAAVTDQVRHEAIPLPNFRHGELDDKPPYFNDVHTGAWSPEHPLHGQFPLAGQGEGRCDYSAVPEADQRRGRAYYYKLVERIDEAMGEILHSLERCGFLENTLIVFASDHGEMLGDHGLWMKGPFHYEPLVGVPWIMMWAGRLPKRRVRGIASLADLAPTVLRLCGMSVPSDMDGCDLADVLLHGRPHPRQGALVETVDDPAGIRCKTWITHRYKVTVHYGQAYGELYDLEQDPHEYVNLWDRPDCRQIKQRLILELMNELEKVERREPRNSYA